MMMRIRLIQLLMLKNIIKVHSQSHYRREENYNQLPIKIGLVEKRSGNLLAETQDLVDVHLNIKIEQLRQKSYFVGQRLQIQSVRLLNASGIMFQKILLMEKNVEKQLFLIYKLMMKNLLKRTKIILRCVILCAKIMDLIVCFFH